jgi:hypothetical protein
MNQPMDNLTPPLESSETSLGRRKLLKALATGGGAIVATTTLPGQWVKPLIEIGLLPAHAQASSPAVVAPFSIIPEADPLGGPITTCPEATITIISATLSPAPPAGQTVTFTIGDIVPNNPAFPPTFSQTTGTATTDAAGVAIFNTPVTVSGDTGDTFVITFSSPGAIADAVSGFSIDNSFC